MTKPRGRPRRDAKAKTLDLLLQSAAPGQTLEEVARRIGISHITLASIRSGARRPTNGTVALLAQFLRITPARVRGLLARHGPTAP